MIEIFDAGSQHRCRKQTKSGGGGQQYMYDQNQFYYYYKHAGQTKLFIDF